MIIPPKTVVLTFDDAVKSHRTTVGPLLRELGFGASFFISHRWMEDGAHFMSWQDVRELHDMGFEIGNHSWTHGNFSTPRGAARMAGELALVDYELKRVGVPKPVSFAWSGNGFGPESLAELEALGYQFARRGGQPEIEYGRATIGHTYDPTRRHPLLIPTTGDSYPNWTFQHFQQVVSRAVEGEAAVLQYHGVPDVVHPWVHTEPALFEQCMRWLKAQGYRAIALRDLAPYIDRSHLPDDPVKKWRYPLSAKPALAPEMAATQARLTFWRGVMARHSYTKDEAQRVTGVAETAPVEAAAGAVLPYPGGRHPRLGFFDGCINPLRGTKASLFLPWDPESYLVIDLPEAIFADGRLIFLAHTHIPTVWDRANQAIENVDWTQSDSGGLRSVWRLPDNVEFGASVEPVKNGASLELWLRNGSPSVLRDIRAQVCVLLGRARAFQAQTNANKRLGSASARVEGGGHFVEVEWQPTRRVWANPPCPCMHADPGLPDCEPGQTVRSTGLISWG